MTSRPTVAMSSPEAAEVVGREPGGAAAEDRICTVPTPITMENTPAQHHGALSPAVTCWLRESAHTQIGNMWGSPMLPAAMQNLLLLKASLGACGARGDIHQSRPCTAASSTDAPHCCVGACDA